MATVIIPILMIITGINASITIVPIFILLFIALYYIKTNAYKLYKISGISDKEASKIEEEKKWVKNKNKLAIVTWVELIATGVVLFIVRKFIRRNTRKTKPCI